MERGAMDQLARLTERERACLRLVANAMSSKEIARQFGIEPGTVDKALKSAMGKLGTSSRRTAARMLVSVEDAQKLAPQPGHVAPGRDQDTMDLTMASETWSPPWGERESVHEEQTPYRVIASHREGFRFPLPRYEGDRNDLTIGKRLIWIGMAALGIIVAVGTLITITTGVSRVIVSIVHALS